MVQRKCRSPCKFLVKQGKIWDTQVLMICRILFVYLFFAVAFLVCPINAILGFSSPFWYLRLPALKAGGKGPSRLCWGTPGPPVACATTRNSHKTQAWFYCERRSNYSLHKTSCTAILLLNRCKARRLGLTIS